MAGPIGMARPFERAGSFEMLLRSVGVQVLALLLLLPSSACELIVDFEPVTDEAGGGGGVGGFGGVGGVQDGVAGSGGDGVSF